MADPSKWPNEKPFCALNRRAFDIVPMGLFVVLWKRLVPQIRGYSAR